MSTKANLKKLVTKAKRASGYAGLRWEVALIFDDNNPNKPFRPNDEGFVWGGDIELLSNYTKHLKVGTYLECWVYSPDELKDNVYIWLDSETEARVQVCGEMTQSVTLNL